ncbi:MAG: tripartite tricarboxylate transporter substrate binding protein [Deltaproteobacteria bacterium]|nr:tripartite tricarboxylate transporter substrate binding protein [Deltaproteobacteria bacterium]RLA89158.1 MAG: tripartite tricarboxylate transporter substrate binding protein [Deltaproteobacteria bacterium]
MKKFFLLLSLTIFCIATVSGIALAKYPEKAITYVICFNPGGESDITARIQQKPLEKVLGVPIIMVYKKGGGGAVGWSELTRTKPDGYTIFGTNLPHIIVQPLTRKNAGYKTEQIHNVYIFEFTPNVLAVKKDSEIKTLKDFVEYAKKHPNLPVGGSGQPSANSLGTVEFSKVANLKLNYISFTGSGAAVPALFGGHVKALMTYTSMAARYPDKMRALAVAAEKRAKALPDVPTFKELGYNYVEGAYRGAAVPPGTPENVRKVLEKAFEKVNHDPTVIKKMEDLGFIMEYYGEAESKKLVDKLTVYYRNLLKELGLLKK